MISTNSNFPTIYRKRIDLLQVNLGYKCNQVCKHCHVDAGPHRYEMMSPDNISKIPLLLTKYNINTLDLTGGAPELHPYFRTLVSTCSELDVQVIDRCNLTILTEEGYQDLAKFLAKYKVNIIASLPCYEKENVDKQRGNGVFERSIEGLRILNRLGYGKIESDLELDLVYNPQGPTLPPPQSQLEQDYKYHLSNKYGVFFNKLLTITNMPIKRFADQLRQKGQLENYINLLHGAHNESNISNLMCRNQLSVDWQGKLYDCDFNQQLGIPLLGSVLTIDNLIDAQYGLDGLKINVGCHCFGCTAGSGSSCGGALTS